MELTAMQIATRRHREADAEIRLKAGTYGSKNGIFQGCSVGCLAYEVAPDRIGEWMDINLHAIVASAYDYPEWMACLQDAIFEGLPEPDRYDWHVQIADAIAARGRDWSIILHAVHAAILRIALPTAGDATQAVEAVLALHERAASGETIGDLEWSAAWSAAETAAESAAWSAARSAAASAAWSAAWRQIRDTVLTEITKAA
jgi:hypothetical protein